MFGKTKEYLKSKYGNPNDYTYKPDVDINAKYHYDYMRMRHNDFYIDDITWDDLDLDRVYESSNHCLTTSGEQYLYYLLRRPCKDYKEFTQRAECISYFEENSEIRDKIRHQSYKLGKSKIADIFNIFNELKANPLQLLLFIATSITSVILIILSILGNKALIFYAFYLVAFNVVMHEVMVRRHKVKYASVNYTLDLYKTSNKIINILDKSGYSIDESVLKARSKLNFLRFFGGFSIMKGQDPFVVLDNIFLFDLIKLELVIKTLCDNKDELFVLHSFIGKIDSAIAIGSYKKSLKEVSNPKINFDKGEKPFIKCEDFTHPGVKNCVPNSIETEESILITGSNASGKSTYLKAIGINIVLAQSFTFALCKSYTATSFKLLSSMAVSDSIEEGDSYYVAEIKAIKRIIDYPAHGERVFCILDELLRGTNTVERVAAASTILKEISGYNLICLAATHDIELCRLLSDDYRQFHFRENVVGDHMTFDYKIQDGPTKTRNAIKLLSIMGFEEKIIKDSEERANRFVTTGEWK